MSDLAKRGPIHSQAEGVVRLLHSPDTIVHLVTLLEDMPVTETLEADRAPAGDRPAGRHHHRQRRDRAAAAGRQSLDAAAEGRPGHAKQLAAGLAAGRHRRRRRHARRAHHAGGRACHPGAGRGGLPRCSWPPTGLPMLSLPRLVDGADLGGVYELADRLLEQGVS